MKVEDLLGEPEVDVVLEGAAIMELAAWMASHPDRHSNDVARVCCASRIVGTWQGTATGGPNVIGYFCGRVWQIQ